MSTHTKAVALFVRHPIPGRVKTRLASYLGDENACDLYKAMVADVLANIRACLMPVFLFHDGEDAAQLPDEWLRAAYSVVRQEGDSIGDRMTAAFEHLFAVGIERGVLVGSDIPGMDVKLLQSAFEAIEIHDVAIAPSFDGGYCLISFKKEAFDARVFHNISWSTFSVLRSTVNACNDCELKYQILESRQDVDTIDDLRAYWSNPSDHSPATSQWLSSATECLKSQEVRNTHLL